MRDFVTPAFVQKLFLLFESDDPRERDYLKTIMHRIYGRFMGLRAYIRQQIMSLLFHVLHEEEQLHAGLAEILEILASIVSGFATPLKEEYKTLLERSLIPLHKVSNLSAFHQQLSQTVVFYVEKDPYLSAKVVSGLLRFWPQTNSAKEILFLNELEEVLEKTPPQCFGGILERLFSRLSICISSVHF